MFESGDLSGLMTGPGSDLPFCLEPNSFRIPLLAACAEFFREVVGANTDVLVQDRLCALAIGQIRNANRGFGVWIERGRSNFARPRCGWFFAGSGRAPLLRGRRGTGGCRFCASSGAFRRFRFWSGGRLFFGGLLFFWHKKHAVLSLPRSGEMGRPGPANDSRNLQESPLALES